ncbi:MAG: DJ-1/PfpI family protein, partial [Synergistota bacterium]|nr:DJ-1/PfpI family protein [Synergistota bacterium]
MRKAAIIVFVINFVILGGATFTMAGSYVSVAEKTGISIIQEDGVIAWTGPYGGKIKPNGPLAGKKIGLIVGCEFSDWQAYYLASFIGEFGGTPQFVMNNNHLWKETRPMRGTPTEPHGMWGLSLTGGMDGLGLNGNRLEYPVVTQKGKGLAAEYSVADPQKYDAIVILGDHSGDILCADDVALGFIKAVADREVPIAAIGGGILPLISLGLMDGKK